MKTAVTLCASTKVPLAMRKSKTSESDRAAPSRNVLANRRRHFIEGDCDGKTTLSLANSWIPDRLTFPVHYESRMRDPLAKFQRRASRVANINTVWRHLQAPAHAENTMNGHGVILKWWSLAAEFSLGKFPMALWLARTNNLCILFGSNRGAFFV